MRLRSTNENVTIVGFYSQPGNKVNGDKELTYACSVLYKQNQLNNLIIAGDFNRSLADVTALAKKIHSWPAQSEGSQFVTHTNTRRPSNDNQLDYVLTNMRYRGT